MKRTEKLRGHWGGLSVAVLAVVALSLTAAATLGGFSATIDNNTNTFSSGTIQLEEGEAALTCYSTGTGTGGSVDAANTDAACAIDNLGHALDQVPAGTAVSTTITLTNVGNKAASTSSLISGACVAAAAGDDNGYIGADLAANAFCGKVDVTIANTTTGATDKCVYPTQTAVCPTVSSAETMSSLSSTTFTTPMSALAAGASATYVITAQLDTSATNADQGLQATIPLTWAISQ